MPPAPVLPVRVGRQEVDTSLLNGFPNSQCFSVRLDSSSGAKLAAFFVAAREAGLLSVSLWVLVLKFSAPSARYCQVLGGTGLALSEPVVPRCVWISLVKFPEFLQAVY